MTEDKAPWPQQLEAWCVVDKENNVTLCRSVLHARCKAAEYDADYPSLQPHRVARFLEDIG